MTNPMVTANVRLIKYGLKTIEDVPENIRAQVQEAIKKIQSQSKE